MKALLALVVATLVIAGCAGNLSPNTSFEAKTAIKGKQVMTALRGVIPTVKALTCTTAPAPNPRVCLLPSETQKVAIVIGKAGAIGEELAKVLEVVDKATAIDDRLKARDRATTLLADINRLLTEATLPVEAEGARQAIVTLIQPVALILFTVLS